MNSVLRNIFKMKKGDRELVRRNIRRMELALADQRAKQWQKYLIRRKEITSSKRLHMPLSVGVCSEDNWRLNPGCRKMGQPQNYHQL